MLYIAIAACYSIASSSKVDAKQAVLCFYGTTFCHQDLFNKTIEAMAVSVLLSIIPLIYLLVSNSISTGRGKAEVVSVNNVWDDTTQLDIRI